MKHKNATPKNNDDETFPFTSIHLAKFKRELKEAGSFFNLMIQKKALSKKMGMKYISLYYNAEKYKQKFLTREYKSLRPMYDTDMPYIFWSALHEALLKTEPESV